MKLAYGIVHTVWCGLLFHRVGLRRLVKLQSFVPAGAARFSTPKRGAFLLFIFKTF